MSDPSISAVNEIAAMTTSVLAVAVLALSEVAFGFQAASRLKVVERSGVIVRGWGGEVTWQEVSVKRNEEAAKGMRSISLDISPETAAAFEIPGQFVQLKLGESKPGFYAIASPPSQKDTFEFLVKETESNAWLTSASAGDNLSMSDVAGKGFDVTQFDGETGATNAAYDGFQCMNVVLLATGSGISPIRSTIESGVAVGLPKPATLYYGCRDADHAAYADKFDSWRDDFNVEVKQVHSQPLDGYTGLTGYVQDALKANGIAVPRNTGACICGQKDMFLACKDVLLEAGVFEGRVLTNF